MKATPKLEGMPPEVKRIIVKNLNFLDRLNYRNVSQYDRSIADELSYQLESIDILTNTTEHKITIKEADGNQEELHQESDIRDIISIFKNPLITIENLNIESKADAFGGHLRDLARRIEQIGLAPSSVKVTNFSISSDEYQKPGVSLRYSDIADTSDLRDLLELCDVTCLKKLKIESKMAISLMNEIEQTEQWRSVESIHLRKNDKIPVKLFNNWRGKHLMVQDYSMEHIVMPARNPNIIPMLSTLFRVKPLGSSFKIHCGIVSVNYPHHFVKSEDPKDATKSIYVFYSPLFVRGFVRPNDGTAEGYFQCPPDENRHCENGEEREDRVV